MHASPGQEEDYTLVLPWPPGVRIACLCLFHGLFRTIRNGVCQSLTSSRGLYHRETVVDGKCGRPCLSVATRVWSTAGAPDGRRCVTIPQSVVRDSGFRNAKLGQS